MSTIRLFGFVDEKTTKLEISGVTKGLANGTEVNILIRDIEGNSTSVTAVIQSNSFVVANIDTTQFKAGNLTFTATAGDAFAQATTPLLEIPSGDPIVITTQPFLNGANKLTINGKAPSLKPNDELTLEVRDTSGTKVTTTAVVQADGTFSVSDLSTQGLQDGLLIIDVMAQTINGAISVVNAANVTLSTLTPLGSDKILQATEDVGLAITAADFGYSNTDGFSMTGVKIAGLPAQGTLKLDGVAVVMDQFVKLADLNAGKLVFLGAANANGTSYANFKFKVLDTRPVNNEDLVANTLSFNVTPVNDPAVISGTAAGNVTEASGVSNATPGTPTASGTLTSTDVDGVNNAFTAVTTATSSTSGFGTYTMTAAGLWTYNLNNSNSTVQALVAGATLTDTFTVTAADGTPSIVTVTITGANDAAVISGTATGGVTEAGGVANGTTGTPTASGTLTATDVDGATNAFTAVTTATASTSGFGTYTMTAAGLWTYNLNNSNSTVQALVAGATLTDSFTVTAADGTPRIVTVTITGTNDAAVISGPVTGTVTEAGGVANATAGTPTASGTLTATDVDGATNAFTAVTTAAASTSGFGTFTMTAAGLWTYNLNNSNATVQGLAAAATLTDTFTVTAADGTARVVTVTITGSNDAAVISGTTTGTVTEAGSDANGNAIGGTPGASGNLTSTDVDGTPNAFTAVSTATATTNGYGSYTMTAGGAWAYTLNNANAAVQALTGSQTLTDTFNVTAADGTIQTVTVTINSANDAATFTGDLTKTITETNTAQTVGGTLTVTDVDSPTTVVAQTAVNGSAGYGKFTISTGGVWSYTMNTAQNQFEDEIKYDDTLTVTTADGTQQVIKVTITGTNDTPTVVSSTSSTGKITFTEDGSPVQARGGTITLADAEQVNLQGATVQVVDMNTGNPVTGDTLTFTTPTGSGITSDFDAATGTLTFTGSATQAQYQSLFDSVKFSNARNDLSGGARNVFYAVKDGSGEDSSKALTRVDVVRKNDAPVLDNTTNLSLTGIAPTVSDVPPTGRVGVLVSDLVGGVSDADLTLADGVTAVAKGIAIVGVNSALGKVFFSIDNAIDRAIPPIWFTPSFDITDTTALLLKADANTRVFFRPNAGVEGTIANALTIRAWDTTDNKTSLIGANVIQHNVSASLGGTNAYSVAVDTVSLNVATVASAPAYNGTNLANTLNGTTGNDVILGNGGADVINALEGNDKVVLNASNVTELSAANSASINGGAGVNILKIVGTEVTLDLTNATVLGKVDSFSTVDITSNVNNLLKLNLATVQTFSGTTDNAATNGVDESKMMMVLGDAGDAVVLQDAASWAVQSSLKGSDLATLYGADYGFSGTRQYSRYSKGGATLFVDELAPVGDIVGTSGNDTLTGTNNADVIYGNGGVDAIAAGAGKDTVILGASSLTALAATTNTAAVNGGIDINTLKLSGINLNLDLTNVTTMNKLDNFNVIDMKQGSGNVFKLGLSQVLALAGGIDNTATLGVDESKMLVLQGNGGVAFNTLQLVDGVNWTSVTNQGGTGLQTTYGADYGFEAGRSYTQYTNGSANLFVDQSLLQTMV